MSEKVIVRHSMYHNFVSQWKSLPGLSSRKSENYNKNRNSMYENSFLDARLSLLMEFC